MEYIHGLAVEEVCAVWPGFVYELIEPVQVEVDRVPDRIFCKFSECAPMLVKLVGATDGSSQEGP